MKGNGNLLSFVTEGRILPPHFNASQVEPGKCISEGQNTHDKRDDKIEPAGLGGACGNIEKYPYACKSELIGIPDNEEVERFEREKKLFHFKLSVSGGLVVVESTTFIGMAFCGISNTRYPKLMPPGFSTRSQKLLSASM